MQEKGPAGSRPILELAYRDLHRSQSVERKMEFLTSEICWTWGAMEYYLYWAILTGPVHYLWTTSINSSPVIITGKVYAH